MTELNIVYHHSNQYNIRCHKAELSEYLMLKFVSARYIFVHPKICPGTVWVQQVLPPFSASEENHKPFGSAQQNLEPAHFQSEVGFVRMFFQIHLSFGLYTSPVRLVAIYFNVACSLNFFPNRSFFFHISRFFPLRSRCFIRKWVKKPFPLRQLDL